MKRILTIQDISCVGRCSLTGALPSISAAGVEAGVLPTAVLSTHTMFPKFTFCDLTDEIEGISNAFSELNIGFDAIYTAYLGSFRQLGLVSDLIDQHRTENNLVVIDPAMADNGKLYPAFSSEFARAMAGLCGKADLIIPNLTEAAFMLGEEYMGDKNYSADDVKGLLERLCALGAPVSVLTGVSLEEGRCGVMAYDSCKNEFYEYYNEHLPVSFHGTGDVFASGCFAALMSGQALPDALKTAVEFTLDSIRQTISEPDHIWYGVNFEKSIPKLLELL